jgi:hypothetical protein
MPLLLRTGNFGRLFSEGIEPPPPLPPAALRLRRQAALHENLSVRARRLMRVVAGLAPPAWRRLSIFSCAIDWSNHRPCPTHAAPGHPPMALPALPPISRWPR